MEHRSYSSCEQTVVVVSLTKVLAGLQLSQVNTNQNSDQMNTKGVGVCCVRASVQPAVTSPYPRLSWEKWYFKWRAWNISICAMQISTNAGDEGEGKAGICQSLDSLLTLISLWPCHKPMLRGRVRKIPLKWVFKFLTWILSMILVNIFLMKISGINPLDS